MTDTRRLDEAIDHLVRAAQNGSSAAFDELVRRCYDQIYRWALTHTDDADDADDVTQEVLVRLHRRLSSYRGQSRFTTWLYQVTRNASLEIHRSRGRRRRLHVQLERNAGAVAELRVDRSDELDTANASAVVRKVFETLPPGQRRVFDLADLQGFTPKEIGGMLGTNAVTVRAHLCKARRAIRKTILEQYPRLAEELSS